MASGLCLWRKPVFCPCSQSPHNGQLSPEGNLIFFAKNGLSCKSLHFSCSKFSPWLSHVAHVRESKYSMKNYFIICKHELELLTQLCSDSSQVISEWSHKTVKQEVKFVQQETAYKFLFPFCRNTLCKHSGCYCDWDCGRQISWLLCVSLALSADQQQLYDLKWLGLPFLWFNVFGWNPINLTCLIVLMLPQVTLQLLYQGFMSSSCLRYKHQVFSTDLVNQTWQLPALAWVRDLDPFPLWQVSPEISFFVPLSGQKFQPEVRKHFLLNGCVSAKYFASWKGFNWKVPVRFWCTLTPKPQQELGHAQT